MANLKITQLLLMKLAVVYICAMDFPVKQI